MDRLRLPLTDEVLDLLQAFGVPYSYGAGMPRDGHDSWPDGTKGTAGGVGWDCSGLAQACLVRLGKLVSTAPDRSAAALFDFGTPVVDGEELLGDLAFYGVAKVSHVTIVLGPGLCLGANGGYANTNADNPRAFVRLEPIHFRPDFRGLRRFAR